MDLEGDSVSALSLRLAQNASRGIGGLYYLEGVGDYANSHELLSVVATIHHQRVGKALNDGTIRLSESLDGIATSGVGDVDRVSNLDVVTVVQVKSAKGSFSVRCPQLQCRTRSPQKPNDSLPFQSSLLSPRLSSHLGCVQE